MCACVSACVYMCIYMYVCVCVRVYVCEASTHNFMFKIMLET